MLCNRMLNEHEGALSLCLGNIYIIITKAFGLPKWSLFSNYKVMLLLCHLRVN